MDNLAQLDRIITEVNDLGEKEKLAFVYKLNELFDNDEAQIDEEVPVESVFGLWKGRNITKETLRKKAWMKN
ncbi:MAG: hypothetical protein FWC24_04695 [Treponema sp.]|nr:hypothetical protein [Treponema sp.]